MTVCAYCTVLFTLYSSHSEKSPSQYIIDIHTQYLKKICQDSNLQGLEYWGGPLVKCVCECGDKEVLEFVKYENGDSVETKPACSYCFHLYDVNILLKSQVMQYCENHTHACNLLLSSKTFRSNLK